MEAPAPSRQARRSAGRLIFTQRHHRARRARAHASIRRSSSYAYLRLVYVRPVPAEGRRRSRRHGARNNNCAECDTRNNRSVMRAYNPRSDRPHHDGTMYMHISVDSDVAMDVGVPPCVRNSEAVRCRKCTEAGSQQAGYDLQIGHFSVPCNDDGTSLKRLADRRYSRTAIRRPQIDDGHVSCLSARCWWQQCFRVTRSVHDYAHAGDMSARDNFLPLEAQQTRQPGGSRRGNAQLRGGQ
ncbi:hypothetical protein ACVWXO_006230 [Bradyrhizobium sp. LM2.7]